MPGERPNILLIITDQQRADCLGIDGHPVLQTPYLDYIAQSGVRFTRAYSEVPSCIPARHVLMAGQAPDEVGLVGFCYRSESCPWDPPATLADELSKAGYETRMIGKLHLQPQRKRYGFDAMELADGLGGTGNDFVDWLKLRGVPKSRMPSTLGMGNWIGRPGPFGEDETYAYWAVERALDFLRKRDPSTPFFLNVSIFEPHPPLICPPVYFHRYDRLDLPQPCVGSWVPPFRGPRRGLNPRGGELEMDLDPLTMHHCRAAYYGLVNHVDHQLGRLIGGLGAALENTYILFVSDHGEMLGDHHLYGKCEPFESSARVPFLLRPPRAKGEYLQEPDPDGEYPRGIVRDEPVGLQDVMPTLLDAAGIDVPASCTGRSVLPLARGESVPWRDELRGEHSGFRSSDAGFHYLVGRRRKYIWWSQSGQERLFDLVDDPLELKDLSDTEDLSPWRVRLAEELASRPEGFSDGRSLIPGRPHRVFVPGKGPTVEWPTTRA